MNITYGALHYASNDYSAIRINRDTGKEIVHKGIDISNHDGLSYIVISPVVGTVVYSGTNEPNWPASVTIRSVDGFYHVFMHLHPSRLIKIGSLIIKGQPIGRTSSSVENKKFRPTSSMSAHVHYEIRTQERGEPARWPAIYCDPVAFLTTGKYSVKKIVPRKYPMRF